MVKDNLVTGPAGTTLEQAKEILQKHKVEKLLLVNGKGELAGLITMRDIDRVQQYPIAARDQRGRLRVGAAVSVHDYERIEALIGRMSILSWSIPPTAIRKTSLRRSRKSKPNMIST